MNKKNILVIAPLRFYSPEDEELFFGWIKKIKCIKSFEGIGRELQATIHSRPITFNEYRSLNGLFRRYNLKNNEQLKELFGTTENTDWFED